MQFKDVWGQAMVKNNLVSSFKKDRLHHTQLFLNKPGAGGLPLALAYAQLVNCENPTPTDSCGECRSCNLNSRLVHPDVHFSMPTITRKSGHKPIAAEFVEKWRETVLENPYLSQLDWLLALNAENKQGNITAKECKEIINFFKLKRSHAGYRVLIIWGAEALAKEGNRLLKLLEEPTENTLIILIANDEEKIINTIISRSQVVRIPSIKDDVIKTFLVETTALENEAINACILMANGDLRLAKMHSQGKEINQLHLFKDWLKAIAAEKLLLPKTIDKIAGIGREQLKMLLDYSVILLRESLFIQEGEPVNRLNADEEKMAQWIAKKINAKQLNTIIIAFDQAPYAIERNGNAKIQLMHLSLIFDEGLSKSIATNKIY